MKTTVEISDPLLDQVRTLAAREGSSVRALVELGLRRLVTEHSQAEDFRMRRASFRGDGLRPELQDASWERLRGLAYEEHGG